MRYKPYRLCRTITVERCRKPWYYQANKKISTITIFYAFVKGVKKNMWDVFICHASEDKKEFVNPLAKNLVHFGVKVWYDEFELKVGDSLTASIERGLRESRYGIVILSKAFFEKKWTGIELNTLINKTINGEGEILPVLWGLTIEDVRAKHIILPDIMSIDGNRGVTQITKLIIEKIRPDIFNDLYMKKMAEKLYKNYKEGLYETKDIPFSQLDDGNEKHNSLPIEIVLSSMLICTIFDGVEGFKVKDMIIDFKRDLDYKIEFTCWATMAYVYLSYIQETGASI
ncbi:MAG: toll/interleukin-1 receptor domain-containing protein, partial [Lachnospiraceae bacterium]|nr:toll/interleukin-1 receptor domain-containing protein [Lachnospiraceae bacterium]